MKTNADNLPTWAFWIKQYNKNGHQKENWNNYFSLTEFYVDYSVYTMTPLLHVFYSHNVGMDIY